MPSSDFLGTRKSSVVYARCLLARGSARRDPSGARGAGKYTLTLMLARGTELPGAASHGRSPDFCGRCANCTRIAQAEDLDARFAKPLKPATVCVMPIRKNASLRSDSSRCASSTRSAADDDQGGSGRHVIGNIYFRPAEAANAFISLLHRRSEKAANSLLKGSGRAARVRNEFFCSPRMRRASATIPLPVSEFCPIAVSSRN